MPPPTLLALAGPSLEDLDPGALSRHDALVLLTPTPIAEAAGRLEGADWQFGKPTGVPIATLAALLEGSV